MKRAAYVIVAAAAAAAAILAACVADDPSITNGPPLLPDGGPTGTDASTDSPPAAIESGAPTCAGQSFDAPQAIVIGDVDGGSDDVVGIRLAGNVAYYTKRFGDVMQLFVGTLTPGAAGVGPRLDGQQVLVPPKLPPEGDVAAAVARDASFVIFTHDDGSGAPMDRKLWAAVAGGGLGFVSPGPLNELLFFNGDDADPWVAGNPTRAVYWGRAAADVDGVGQNGARRITRATLKPRSGDKPEVGAAEAVSSPCEAGYNCGAPVVTPDEKMMLFGTWKREDFKPRIQEVALISDLAANTVAPDTKVIEHPELGERIASWISDDGCEVIVSKLDSASLGYARRTPR